MAPAGIRTKTVTAITDIKSAHQQKLLDRVALWAGYYRFNPHRFAKDFLHVDLHLFQKILLVMMNLSSTFAFIACRGLGKSWLCAVYCCIRCVLYPGEKICIASGTRGQAQNVLEKIMTEIKPNSAELAYEIDEKNTRITAQDAKIVFKNGSFIKVVTASDSSRGNRAHILIIDEFRLVKKDVIDTILKKFLSNPRRPQYMGKAEYKHNKELIEPLQTLYLSSAYYKDHWSYTKCKDTCRLMLSEARNDFVCGFPYQLALKEGLLSEDRVIEDMTESDFSEIKWSMEMEALFWGDSDGAFFDYDSIAKTRRIQYPMLPDAMSAILPSGGKLRIQPKQNGEKRILSADIALMQSTKHNNDATAIFINQLLPTKAGRYSNNIVYTETTEGAHTEDQALRIRKLFDEYSCDYIVLDCKGVGIGVFDALARDITDSDTGEIYPALSCCNNPEYAARCSDKNAPKVIWAINATAKFNSDCAVMLREAFRSGKIRLLINEYDGEELLGDIKGYSSLTPSEKTTITMPYLNTTFLISELINLEHEESAGLVKISEKSGKRKDRYSSLSYNYWVACQIESQIKRKSGDIEYKDEMKDIFTIRAPKIK